MINEVNLGMCIEVILQRSVDLHLHLNVTQGVKVNILAQLYRNSGILSTDVPDVDTGIDWLDCFAQNLQ